MRVVERQNPYEGGKTQKQFVPCKKNDEGARHRYQHSKKIWIPFTPGLILAFLSVLIYRSANGALTCKQMWAKTHSTGVAWIRNSITSQAFNQVRRYIHFSDNANMHPKTDSRWHPLQKIKHFMDHVQGNLQKAWTLGKKICVDESMIKYMGRAISWVQYMPAKPIKHGIKVYCLCCAATGMLYAFEIYTGAESGMDGSPTEVVMRLLSSAGTVFGRILYTDNFYTSLDVMEKVYDSYKMLMVGTYKLTKKKSRTGGDFPYHRLSGSALKKVDRGWFRSAVRSIKTSTGALKYKVRATV